MRTRYLLLAVCALLVALGGARAQRNVADDEAIRQLYTEFFEAYRQAGVNGAAGYLRQSGTVDEDTLRELQQRGAAIQQDQLVGRADAYAILRETEIEGDQRYRAVHALTYHSGRPVAWRLRFYKKITGVWVFIDVQAEGDFVEDFLRYSELEFAAYRRILEGRGSN